MARALLVQAASPPAILDFGSGVGNSIPHLVRMFPNAEVHGLDVSGESVELAKAANPTARFGMIGEDSLPLPDYFDGRCDEHQSQCNDRDSSE